MSTSRTLSASVLVSLLVALVSVVTAQSSIARRQLPAFLRPCQIGGTSAGVFCGQYEVFEDRAAGKGRKIGLNIVVLRATGPEARPDPVFYLAGGPGGSAASAAGRLAKSWMRRDRDIVLVDQRGTGKSNPLRVRVPGGDSDLQGYLEPIWNVAAFRRARQQLGEIADLTKYSTPIAMDDLDAVRVALGYDTINLVGGSYGSRAALVYIRRHPQAVRTAILTGIAPIAFKNPLYHAKAAQEGFDRLVAECKADERYAVYHDLDRELATILDRLRQEPATVAVKHPRTGEPVDVKLTATAFAEALRVQMYYMAGNRQVPLLVHRAHAGDYAPFAESGIRSNRRLREYLALGMLMSVVGSEDIPRIEPGEIERQTAGTFLGDTRARLQIAVAEFWPKAEIGADYAEPVRGDMPVLFISGTHDPVTPPRWGVAAARHFPNGRHLAVPAAHGTSDQRIERFKAEFLSAGSLEGLDTTFVAKLKLAPLRLPRQVR